MMTCGGSRLPAVNIINRKMFSLKLKRQMEHEMLFRDMVLEGVVGIQSGMAPGALRSRLAVYLGNHHGGGHGKDAKK